MSTLVLYSHYYCLLVRAACFHCCRCCCCCCIIDTAAVVGRQANTTSQKQHTRTQTHTHTIFYFTLLLMRQLNLPFAISRASQERCWFAHDESSRINNPMAACRGSRVEEKVNIWKLAELLLAVVVTVAAAASDNDDDQLIIDCSQDTYVAVVFCVKEKRREYKTFGQFNRVMPWECKRHSHYHTNTNTQTLFQ